MTCAGAPPWSGPDRVPIAADIAAPASAPVEAATRAVNVEAFSPCSAVQIQYVSMAVTCRGSASPRQRSRKRSAAVFPPRDDVVGDGVLVAVGDPRRTCDDRHDLRGEPAEVVPRLLVGDLGDLPEAPDAGEPRDLGLCVRRRVAREGRGLVRVRLRHARLEALVDEEPPHLLVGDVPDELLDVDAPVAERTTLAIRLGDLRLDRDDAFESRLEVRDFAHPAGDAT